MRVHAHTKFCFLCVLTFLFHQCSHCHGDGHHHHRHGDHAHAHSDLQISQAPYTGPSAGPTPTGRARGEAAESEQDFYIQQLFVRYGQRDRLDFGGFQSLLLSLGLGELRVVGPEHDELGHDHVAHLDLLEVQEGRHSHSSDEYLHPHPHPRQRPPHKHPHDQHSLHNDHDHDHTHDHEQNNDLSREHDQDGDTTHDHSHDDQGSGSQPHHHHDHHHKHPHPHPHLHHNHTPNATDPHSSQEQPTRPPTPPTQGERLAEPTEQSHTGAPGPRPSAASTQTQTSRPKRTRKPPSGNRQRDRNRTPPPTTATGQDEGAHNREHDHGHDDHSHDPSRKGKREVPDEVAKPTVTALAGHVEGVVPHQHEECLNLTQLLHHYGLSPDSLISPTQFTYLCPALLYQIDSRFCIRHPGVHPGADVYEAPLEPAHSAWIWAWGFVSITIISLLSLLGVVLVPILNQSCFKFMLTFLVALAVGTLSGDALLHLLPHAQSGHDHGENKEEKEVDLLTEFDAVWKGLTALGGIYLLFIIEHCLGIFKHYKDQGGTWCQRKKRGEEGKIGRKLSDHKLNRRSDAEWLHLKPLTEGPDSTALSSEGEHNDTQLTELQPPNSPSKTPLALADTEHIHTGGDSDNAPARQNGRKAKTKKHGHAHGHSHGHSHSNCHTDQEMKDAGIASIAWMVIMGDGMHNFSDGLAIGAAFSANITGGISTSVAVFCHELPHELGDFAVLLKAGMSVKQAIVYNLLSALMAYVGMLIGTAVGQYTHNVTGWIFAVTAGMFLYVALVDMLPEMLHGDSEEHKRCQLGHFVLQNFGLLTGFGIMLLIAIFEDQIVLDFGF